MKLLTKNDMYDCASVAAVCQTLSEKTEMDVFFHYTPHVDGYQIDIYYGGWQAYDNNHDDRTIYYEVCLTRNNMNNITKLRKELNRLILEHSDQLDDHEADSKKGWFNSKREKINRLEQKLVDQEKAYEASRIELLQNLASVEQKYDESRAQIVKLEGDKEHLRQQLWYYPQQVVSALSMTVKEDEISVLSLSFHDLKELWLNHHIDRLNQIKNNGSEVTQFLTENAQHIYPEDIKLLKRKTQPVSYE